MSQIEGSSRDNVGGRCILDGLRYLARRAYSREEMSRALMKRGHSEGDVDAALKYLESRGLVNDEEFARERAGRLAGTGRLGPERVVADLLARGIDPNLARRSVKEAYREIDQEEAARRAFGNPESEEDRVRAARRLLRRGFEVDVVRRIFEELGEETGDIGC